MNKSFFPVLLFFASISTINGRHAPIVASTSVRRTLPPQYRRAQQHQGIFSPRRKRTPQYRSRPLDYGDDNETPDEEPTTSIVTSKRSRSSNLKPWSYLTYNNEKSKRPGNLSWTSRIVWINVIAYGVQVVFPSFTQWGLKISDKILRGEDLYRLVSPIFLHGGLTHLATNAFSLNSVGPQVEAFFGPGRFIATYIVSGITGNILSAYKSPNPALGASGAVFGVIGGCAVFLLRNDGYFGERGDQMVVSLTRTIGVNLLFGAMSPMIDNWAHLGGLIGGAAFATLFGPRLVAVKLPNGRQTIIDKPILKLPRYIESIPEKVANRFTKMKRRMQVNFHISELPDKPWRRKPNSNNVERQGFQNRSIKPLDP